MSAFLISSIGTPCSRRRCLTWGGLAALPGLWPWSATGAERGTSTAIPPSPQFGRAKRCVLLYLTGGPPQHDTWDPKPAAPSSVRGEFSPIETAVPGMWISELFPRLAAQANRVRLIRSLTHTDTVHTTAGYAMLTGGMHPQANQVASATMIRPSASDRPHLACVAQQVLGERAPRLPPFALPEIIKDAAVNEFPGLNAGFLSKRYEPVLLEANPERTGFQTPPVSAPGEVSSNRLTARRALRSQLATLPDEAAYRQAELLYRNAFELVQSTSLQNAFRLDQEPAGIREAYGPHLFEQGTLLARRLLEADAKFVTVYWHYEGPDDSPVWDTHWNNFRHLRERLAPPADRALAALLHDLSERGLLEETLVLCLGEFGRSPRINSFGGRDHWPQVANAVAAGAGIPGGTIVGASDATGAYPAHTAISPEDWGTTLLHWLGVPHDHELHDQFGRPHRASLGTIRPEIFG